MTTSGRPAAAIVITNFNYGPFVSQAIDSALAQTIRCEVVVVDDGSDDDSVQKIKAKADAAPGRLTVLTKSNGGQASAFNAGWAAVTAPIVIFLDADDVLEPHAAQSVVERMEAEPEAGKCQFRLGWIDESGRPLEGSFPEANRHLPSGDLRTQLVRNPDDIAWQPTSGNAFRATVLDRILPMPEAPYRISADHYLSNLSALYAPVTAIEAELGRYRVHGANSDFSHRFDVERARQILDRTAETHRHLIEHGSAAGLPVPANGDGFRSLSQAGLRLASHRIGPSGQHPFPADTRRGLTGRAVAAAWGRTDRPVLWRLAAVGWACALAAAPRPLVPRIAGAALTR